MVRSAENPFIPNGPWCHGGDAEHRQAEQRHHGEYVHSALSFIDWNVPLLRSSDLPPVNALCWPCDEPMKGSTSRYVFTAASH